MKIPWILLNIKNPLDKKIYGDFYLDGLDSSLTIKDIGFSINYKNENEDIVSSEGRYNIRNFKEIKYFEKLKDSYYILENYWKQNPR